jgi:hypothetical protein
MNDVDKDLCVVFKDIFLTQRKFKNVSEICPGHENKLRKDPKE